MPTTCTLLLSHSNTRLLRRPPSNAFFFSCLQRPTSYLLTAIFPFFGFDVVPSQFSRPLGNPKRRRTRYLCITTHVHLSIPHPPFPNPPTNMPYSASNYTHTKTKTPIKNVPAQ